MRELRRSRRRVSAEKKPSTALSDAADVGVKWKVQRDARNQPVFSMFQKNCTGAMTMPLSFVLTAIGCCTRPAGA